MKRSGHELTHRLPLLLGSQRPFFLEQSLIPCFCVPFELRFRRGAGTLVGSVGSRRENEGKNCEKY